MVKNTVDAPRVQKGFKYLYRYQYPWPPFTVKKKVSLKIEE